MIDLVVFGWMSAANTGAGNADTLALGQGVVRQVVEFAQSIDRGVVPSCQRKQSVALAYCMRADVGARTAHHHHVAFASGLSGGTWGQWSVGRHFERGQLYACARGVLGHDQGLRYCSRTFAAYPVKRT